MGLIETETEALWRLSSAYEACTLSACDPVFVPLENNILIRRSIFSHVSYNHTYPEKRGANIMEMRIKEAGDDIQTHLRIHDDILSNFYSIDEALKAGNRVRVVKAGRLVFKNLEKYGKLVGKHSKRFKEKAFLQYPTCFPGNIFIPKNSNRTTKIMGKVFNPEQNAKGLEKDIK